MTLLAADAVRPQKKYEYRGQQHYHFRRMPPRQNDHLDVFLEFQNDAKNNLGVPLPGGIMRVYQPDSEGMLQFAGEDRIQHPTEAWLSEPAAERAEIRRNLLRGAAYRERRPLAVELGNSAR